MQERNQEPEPRDQKGEGNVEADRRYREKTTEFARSGKVEPAAREAKEALDGPEGEELERARRESGAHEPETHGPEKD